MRLAPVPMFYSPDRDRILHFLRESSRTTHEAAECVDASRLFGEILFRSLSATNKIEILLGRKPRLATSPSIQAIEKDEYRSKVIDDSMLQDV